MRYAIAALLLGAIGFSGAAHAETVPIEQAQQVADNFVQMMVVQKEGWGAHERATAMAVVPFTRGERLLGYACPVDPAGYVVVSAYRELAPIRAYSMKSDLDIDDDTGPTDALKILQEEVLDGVEAALGRGIRANDDFRAVIGMDFEEAWTTYLDPGFDALMFAEPPRSRTAGIAYQEGDMLLSTTWGQQPPYNDMCPDEDCSWPQYHYFNENARVGCVATAGAQICRYYNWPPTGTGSGYDHAYDWPNMPEMFQYDYDHAVFTSRVEGAWVLATQDHFDSVASYRERWGSASI